MHNGSGSERSNYTSPTSQKKQKESKAIACVTKCQTVVHSYQETPDQELQRSCSYNQPSSFISTMFSLYLFVLSQLPINTCTWRLIIYTPRWRVLTIVCPAHLALSLDYLPVWCLQHWLTHVQLSSIHLGHFSLTVSHWAWE